MRSMRVGVKSRAEMLPNDPSPPAVASLWRAILSFQGRDK
jgi:hypothetical protein